MMTIWHTEDYELRKRKWFPAIPRTRILNANNTMMINDLDKRTAAAIVAEHNHMVQAFNEVSMHLYGQTLSEHETSPQNDSKR